MKFISIPRLKLASEPTLFFQNKQLITRDTPTTETLYSLTIIGNSFGIAVGYAGAIAKYNPTLMEFELDAQSGVITDKVLYAVSADTETNVVAVGRAFTILGYDGTTWSESADSGLYPDITLNSVAHLGYFLLAGGEDTSTNENVIFHKGYYIEDGTYEWHDHWTEVYRGGKDILANGVREFGIYLDTTISALTSYWRFVAVGGLGRMFDSVDWGNTWAEVESSKGLTDELLLGVSFADKPPGFAVGANGTILKFDGASFETAKWEVVPSPTTGDLWSIGMLNSVEGYIVGSAGIFYIWDGISLSSFASGTTTTLACICGSDANFLWTCGALGFLGTFQARTWPSRMIDSAGRTTAGHGKTIGVTEGSEDLPLKQDPVTGKLIIDATYEPSRGTPYCDLQNYSGSAVTYQTLITYTVPTDREFNLHKIEFTRDEDGHAEFQLTIAGTVMFTGFSPLQNVDKAFSPNKLSAGDVILLEVKSDDGTTISVDGDITGDIEVV